MKYKRIMSLILVTLALMPMDMAKATPLSGEQLKTIERMQDSIKNNQRSLDNKGNDLGKQRQEYKDKENKVNAIQDEIEENLRKINEFETKIQALNNDISNIMIKLDELNGKIKIADEELRVAIEKQTQISMANEARVRELYKNGYESSIIELVFSSEDMKDFFDNILLSSKIVAFDKRMLSEADEAKQAVEVKQAELKKLKDEVNGELESLNGKKEELKTSQEAFKKAKEEAELRQAQAELEKNAVYQQLSAVEKEYRAQELVKKKAQDKLISYERSLFESVYSTAMNTSAKTSLEQAIKTLESIKKQLTTDTAIKEINDAISKSKNRLSKWGVKAPSTKSVKPVNNLSAKREQIINYAYTMLGTPYVWGGESWEEGGFDCSGFVQYVYKQFGYRLTRTTYTQIRDGKEVSYSELLPGDLVFPHDGHVGMYIGDGKYIHAPQTGDVIKVSKITKFWRARRIIY